MRGIRYMSPSELPVRPDAGTGLPRPPHAPSYLAGETSGDRDIAHALDPPPNQGPVLVWYRENRRGSLGTVIFAVALIVAVATIGHGLLWMQYWFMWVFIGFIGALAYCLTMGTDEYAAGADWLASKHSWVQTYDLVKVTCSANFGNLSLNLRDFEGHGLEAHVSDLTGDHEMWDLIYNGILHSVIAGGAETNGQLHMSLQVPYLKIDNKS